MLDAQRAIAKRRPNLLGLSIEPKRPLRIVFA
jgi:hypothetical protein